MRSGIDPVNRAGRQVGKARNAHRFVRSQRWRHGVEVTPPCLHFGRADPLTGRPVLPNGCHHWRGLQVADWCVRCRDGLPRISPSCSRFEDGCAAQEQTSRWPTCFGHRRRSGRSPGPSSSRPSGWSRSIGRRRSRSRPVRLVEMPSVAISPALEPYGPNG